MQARALAFEQLSELPPAPAPWCPAGPQWYFVQGDSTDNQYQNVSVKGATRKAPTECGPAAAMDSRTERGARKSAAETAAIPKSRETTDLRTAVFPITLSALIILNVRSSSSMQVDGAAVSEAVRSLCNPVAIFPMVVLGVAGLAVCICPSWPMPGAAGTCTSAHQRRASVPSLMPQPARVRLGMYTQRGPVAAKVWSATRACRRHVPLPRASHAA